MEVQNHSTEVEQSALKGSKMGRNTAVMAIVMGSIMVAIYMGMAFLLVFTNLFIGKVPEWIRYMMGAVFFVYGIYRAFRIVKARR